VWYRAWQALLCVGGAGLTWSRVAAQTGAPPAAQAAETVTAGVRYGAGWLHRLLLGAHYRDLWTTPVRVPVLDLGGFAGGLTPLRRGGGRETKSLRLQGANGRVYAFRSVDKDPTAALPPDLRQTFITGSCRTRSVPLTRRERSWSLPSLKQRACSTLHPSSS